MDTTIAVLAGGESRRMGRDKAQIVWNGVPLLERTVRLAQSVCPSVAVVGRAEPEGWPLPHVPFLADEQPGQGPLGGLATALRHSPGRAVLLVACDMPRLTPAALTWLLRQEQMEQHDGVVTRNGEQREPLFALYTPTALPLIERQLAAGRRSLQAMIDRGTFAFADTPPEVAAALRDVDTPEDLAGLD